MSNRDLNSLDDFQRFVSSTIKLWSREQRIALAAAMAERWLPVFESFSGEEEWCNASSFQDALQAVWNCALGHTLTPKDQRHHKKRVEENTPHLDDCDAEELIAASAIIDCALDCCLNTDNTDDAVMAMVSGFEGVAPGIYTDAGQPPPEFWSSPEVDAMKKGVKQLMDDSSAIDEKDMDNLRRELMSTPFMTDKGVGPLPSEALRKANVYRRQARRTSRSFQSPVAVLVTQTRLLFEVMRNVSCSAVLPVPVNTSICWPTIPTPMSVALKVFDDHGLGRVEICT